MSESEKNQKQKRRGCGCGGDFKEAKLVVLVPFKKAKKLLTRCGKVSIKKNPNPNPSSEISGKRLFVHSCFCFKQPSTLESPVDSVTSDPNDSKFTFEMLRSLIENNDFYSKECNPHLDHPSSSASSTDDSCAK